MGGGAKGLLLFSANSDYSWSNNTYVATNCNTSDYDYFIVEIAHVTASARPSMRVSVYVEKNQNQTVYVSNGGGSYTTRGITVDNTGVLSTQMSRADRGLVTALYGFKKSLT